MLYRSAADEGRTDHVDLEGMPPTVGVGIGHHGEGPRAGGHDDRVEASHGVDRRIDHPAAIVRTDEVGDDGVATATTLRADLLEGAGGAGRHADVCAPLQGVLGERSSDP